jgi:xanthine dehydrogenase accessory factor
MNRNDWIAHAARLESEDRAFALVTVLRAQAPTSAKAGDKALVTEDGQIHGWIGGGCAQPAVVKTVRQALTDGIPRSIRITPTDETAERSLGDVLEFGMACHSGGTLELFVDPVLPAALLTVVGDSPVARALTGLATRLGFRVVLVAQHAQASDYAEATLVVNTDDPAEVRQRIAQGGLVVVATQGRRDVQGLKAALSLQPYTLWFVASERKANVLRESLIASGEDAAQVAAMVSPAGQAINAHTPEEIALSVLADIVTARRVGKTKEAVSTVQKASQTQPRSELELAPVEAAGCCASQTVAIAPVSVEIATAALAPAAAAPKSCCGG